MMLRHIVMFTYKSGVSEAQRAEVVVRFAALAASLPLVRGFEHGTNVSPEGLGQGYDVCFLLNFSGAADRDAYLPHPAHRQFVDFVGPFVERALVFDYTN